MSHAIPVRSAFSEPSGARFLVRIVLPIFSAAAVMTILAAGLLVWAARSADRVAIDRQHRLVDLIVSQVQSGIAHDQESVTVWDDAVNAVRGTDTDEWIDVNLGTWMGSYFGHDGAYVLDPSNTPIYAFTDGETTSPSAFGALASETLPLVDTLRRRLRAGDTEGLSDRILSLGVSDISVVAGHPAVVSVKPIISDSGEIEQTAGEEYVHVAVRYLDQSFITDLKRDYLLDGLRFSWQDDSLGQEQAIPLRASDGRTVGYLAWQPYRPGAAVFAHVAPVLAGLFAIAMAVLALLISVLRKRSMRLSVSEAALHHLAHHDLLTGLANRGQFDARLDAALEQLAGGQRLAVLYLDLDHFKEVNDTFGHPAGDELLREFADRLRRHTSEADVVGRLGGDEFIILLHDPVSEDAVIELCQRVIETARRPFAIAGTQAFVGVSVGVALAPRDGLDRVELTRRADVALYHAKRAGRSEYAIYAPEMDGSISTRRDVERDLRKALQGGEQLQVHYQPLFSASTSCVVGVEALVRWNHPERGWISPDVFVPLAEERGLIEQLGEWVLREACTTTLDWPVQTIAVNVSAVELRNPTFAMRVANTLLATGMNPRRLELEVTESALFDKGGECERNVRALRDMGVRLALDDFGTGFSSLGRLHQMEVDRIKIDRSFVDGFGKANGDEAIVQAIVDLARATGLRTTAEGVETESQSDFLKSIGCDELQGFLLSRPKAAADIEQIWKQAESKRA